MPLIIPTTSRPLPLKSCRRIDVLNHESQQKEVAMSTSIGRVHLAGAFGAIYLLWGGTYLAIALGLQSIPLFLLIGARSILGGAVLLALSGLRPLVRSWEDW